MNRRALLSDYNKKSGKQKNTPRLQVAEEKPGKSANRIGFSLDNARKKGDTEIPVIVIDSDDGDNDNETTKQNGHTTANTANNGFDSESDDDENERTTQHQQRRGAQVPRRNETRPIRRSRSSNSLDSDVDDEDEDDITVRPGRRRRKRSRFKPAPKHVSRLSTTTAGQLPRKNSSATTTTGPRIPTDASGIGRRTQTHSRNFEKSNDSEQAPKRQRIIQVAKLSKDTTSYQQPPANPRLQPKNSSGRSVSNQRAPLKETMKRKRPKSGAAPKVGLCKICGEANILASRGEVCLKSCVSSKSVSKLQLDEHVSAGPRQQSIPSNSGGETENRLSGSKRSRSEFPPDSSPNAQNSANTTAKSTIPSSSTVNAPTQQVADTRKSSSPESQPGTTSQPAAESRTPTTSTPGAQHPQKQQISRASEKSSEQPQNNQSALQAEKGTNKIAVLNISKASDEDGAAQNRLKFFLHRPRGFDPSVELDVESHSPFASSIVQAGYEKSQVCSVCGGSNDLSFVCEKCGLAFHANCAITSIRAFNPQSPRCRGCESSKENTDYRKQRGSPSSITDALKRLIFDSKSGNPIAFVLHPSLVDRFVRKYKSDFLKCSQCAKFRNVLTGVVSECLSLPFHCTNAFWWKEGNGFECIEPVPQEDKTAIEIAVKKRALRSRRRVGLFYSGFGEKNRELFGFPALPAVVNTDKNGNSMSDSARQQIAPTAANNPQPSFNDSHGSSACHTTSLRAVSSANKPASGQLSESQPGLIQTPINKSNHSSGIAPVTSNRLSNQAQLNAENRAPTANATNSLPIENAGKAQPDLSAAGITVSMQPGLSTSTAKSNAGRNINSIRTPTASTQGNPTNDAARPPPNNTSNSNAVESILKSIAKNLETGMQVTAALNSPLRDVSAALESNSQTNIPSTQSTLPSATRVAPVVSGGARGQIASAQRSQLAPPLSSSSIPVGGSAPFGQPVSNIPNNQRRHSAPVSTVSIPVATQARTSIQAPPSTSGAAGNATRMPGPSINQPRTSNLLMEQNQQRLFAVARSAAVQRAANASRASSQPLNDPVRVIQGRNQRQAVPNMMHAQNSAPRNTVPNSAPLSNGQIRNAIPSKAEGQSKMKLTDDDLEIAKQWVFERLGKLPDQSFMDVLVDLAFAMPPELVTLYKAFSRNPERFDSQFIRLSRTWHAEKQTRLRQSSQGAPSAKPNALPPRVVSNGKPLSVEQRLRLNNQFRQVRLSQINEVILFEQEMLKQMQQVRAQDVGKLHEHQCNAKKKKAVEHTTQIRLLLDSVPGTILVGQPPVITNQQTPMQRRVGAGVHPIQPPSRGLNTLQPPPQQAQNLGQVPIQPPNQALNAPIPPPSNQLQFPIQPPIYSSLPVPLPTQAPPQYAPQVQQLQQQQQQPGQAPPYVPSSIFMQQPR